MCQAILYPGSKIIVCAGTLKQANESLLKIRDDFMKKSPMLCSEIFDVKIGQNDAQIIFRNGSWIQTRTSTDNARGARANVIVVDEFRLVDKKIIDTVIREFLKAPRQPGYLTKPEFAHLDERNKEIYMSSTYYKSSWAYTKAQSFLINTLRDTQHYFMCALPYQISIREHLLSREQVRDQMSEADFNEISFMMEDEALWYGDTDGSFFKYDDLDRRRTLPVPFFPLEYYTEKNPVPDVAPLDKRILSLDVALMASTTKKKNDAAALLINDVHRTSSVTYESNFVFADTFEGLTTDELGIIIMRYFYKYKCTDLVIDTLGLGIGVYDFIIKDQYDAKYGCTWGALSCYNSEEMAARCKVTNAPKVIWSVKASASFNNDIAVLLRTGFQNGKINLLQSETNGRIESDLKKAYKGYEKLSMKDQDEFKTSLIQTTLMIYELIKLGYTVNNNQIKVHEESGMRKDRYSSIAYNYWCACQLEQELKPQNKDTGSLIKAMIHRRANYF